MPTNKKKGRASGRTPLPEPLTGATPSSASSSSGPKAVTSSATAKLIEGIGRSSPSRPSATREPPLASAVAPVWSEPHTSTASAPSRAVAPATATTTPTGSPEEAFAEVREELSGEEFEDALEDMAELEASILNKLYEKEPMLRAPEPSREDWDEEMRSLRTLHADDTVEADERVKRLHEAFLQRIEDVRLAEEHRTAVERFLDGLKKEREACRSEILQVSSVKICLQENCKQLQELKGTITTQSTKLIEEEQERRADLDEKFSAAMKDVEEKMGAEVQVREHFVKENEELRTKLQKFTDTYNEQERQLADQSAARTKELDLARQRLKEYQAKSAESATHSAELDKKNKALQKTTATLRAELQAILSKFDSIQDSVTGSNKRHSEVKESIDALSERIKDLEADKKSLTVNEQVQELTKEKENVQKQRDVLERLISNMQKEIASLKTGGSG